MVVFPTVPAKEDGKVTLNLQARFFWEDVPYGLVILKSIGDLLGVKVDHINKQIVWH